MIKRHFQRNTEVRTVAIETGQPPIEFEVWVHWDTEAQSYKLGFMGEEREHAERCFEKECKRLIEQGYTERPLEPS